VVIIEKQLTLKAIDVSAAEGIISRKVEMAEINCEINKPKKLLRDSSVIGFKFQSFPKLRWYWLSK